MGADAHWGAQGSSRGAQGELKGSSRGAQGELKGSSGELRGAQGELKGSSACTCSHPLSPPAFAPRPCGRHRSPSPAAAAPRRRRRLASQHPRVDPQPLRPVAGHPAQQRARHAGGDAPPGHPPAVLGEEQPRAAGHWRCGSGPQLSPGGRRAGACTGAGSQGCGPTTHAATRMYVGRASATVSWACRCAPPQHASPATLRRSSLHWTAAACCTWQRAATTPWQCASTTRARRRRACPATRMISAPARRPAWQPRRRWWVPAAAHFSGEGQGMGSVSFPVLCCCGAMMTTRCAPSPTPATPPSRCAAVSRRPPRQRRPGGLPPLHPSTQHPPSAPPPLTPLAPAVVPGRPPRQRRPGGRHPLAARPGGRLAPGWRLARRRRRRRRQLSRPGGPGAVRQLWQQRQPAAGKRAAAGGERGQQGGERKGGGAARECLRCARGLCQRGDRGQGRVSGCGIKARDHRAVWPVLTALLRVRRHGTSRGATCFPLSLSLCCVCRRRLHAPQRQRPPGRPHQQLPGGPGSHRAGSRGGQGPQPPGGGRPGRAEEPSRRQGNGETGVSGKDRRGGRKRQGRGVR